MIEQEKISSFFKEYKLKPREQQEYVLEKLAKEWDNYKYFVLSLPTGVGKTFISTSIANALAPDGRAYILTSTIQLQNQYEKSWPKLINIKGRGNYQCNLNTAFTVDHAPCTIREELLHRCQKAQICAYYNQRNAAIKSQSMITNPLYFLYTSHCGFIAEGGDEMKRDVLIVDEAHNLEGHIIQFSESKLNFKELHEKYGVECGDFQVSMDENKNRELLEDLCDALAVRIEQLKGKMSAEFPYVGLQKELQEWATGITNKVADKARRWHAQTNHLDKVLQPIKIYFSTGGQWLIHPDMEKNELTLTPLRASNLFHYYLGDIAEKFVFLSATTGDFDTFCRELGIPKEEALFIETDTPFPPEKSPVVVFPILKMGYKDVDKSIPMMVKSVEEIMKEHPQEKGIIHCATYKLGQEIIKRIGKDQGARLIGRDKYEMKQNNEQLIELHKQAENPTVLLSPSMMEGVDLYDDLSRFQIIIKFPWASLGDPRVAAKSKADSDWYSNRTWMHIMQAAGRSTRHENDDSITYILDASFPFFYNKWKNKLPEWFKKRIILQ
jgi:ATP-dependent DNA helicase DinG